MPEKKESLLAELEGILGLSIKDAAAVESAPMEEFASKWAALVDTYRSISNLASSELHSAYEHLFQLVGDVGAPIRYVTEAFAEEEKVPHSGQSRLFENTREQFNELVRAHGSEVDGEIYAPAGKLRKVLQDLMRPPGGNPTMGISMNWIEI